MPVKSVLLIDDDQSLVATMEDGLTAMGFKVTTAFDGLQGVMQAHQVRPDLIILDFQMPAGGGSGVYERLRASLLTAKTPILFLTGVTVDMVRESIHSTPNTYFLKKPTTMDQMRLVLGKILGPDAIPPEPKKEVPFVQPAPPEPPPMPPVPPPPSGTAKAHQFDVRVLYADTDRLGIIYYANYLRYFEAGRTELMRSVGLRYRDMETERKLFTPVVESNCEYLSPSRYDDLLSVHSWVSLIGRASLRFQFEIYNREQQNRLVARGFTRHAVVNEFWKPTRLPQDLRDALAVFLQPK